MITQTPQEGGSGAAENTAVTFKSLTLASPAANTPSILSSGYSLTGSGSQSLVDLSGTWNTTGTPTAIKLDITDTASNAASRLLDLLVGGVSKFSVTKGGVVSAESYGFATSVMSFLMGTDFSVRSSSDYVFGITPSGKLQARSGFEFRWSSDATNYYSGTVDLVLKRSGAATVQLGDNHASVATKQRVKAHDVPTGIGADLEVSGGSGSVDGKLIIGNATSRGYFGAASRVQPTSYSTPEICSALLNCGLLAPILNTFNTHVGGATGQIDISLNSSNGNNVVQAVEFRVSTDGSNWTMAGTGTDDPGGSSPFTSTITSLTPEQEYHVQWRAFAPGLPENYTEWSSTQMIAAGA